MADEALWKQRFLIFTAARLTGVLMFVLGVFLAFTDIGREGGMPLIGGIIAIVGALDAAFVPLLLKSIWDKDDAAKGRPVNRRSRRR